MIRKSIVLTVVALACLFWRGVDGQGQETKGTPAPAKQGPVVADDVVMKVMGESITEKQVLNLIDQIANSQETELPPEQIINRNVVFYREAIETLISGILLKNEAKEKKIVADKAKVDETMKSVKAKFPDEAAYQNALVAQGIKEAELVQSIEDRFVINELISQITKDVPPASEAAIQKFYADNPQFFQQGDQVHAAMILLKIDKDATPEKKAEIKKKLEGIRDDIEGKKITFAEAAAKYSEDPETATAGGDLGYIKRGEFLDALENAAFATKGGMLAPIAETDFGYHLIKVIEFKTGGLAPLDDGIKANIRDYLGQKANQDATQKHVDELKAKVTVETVMPEEEWKKRHAGK
jgi:peptidyl-prolyl cis-trans isomerase C